MDHPPQTYSDISVALDKKSFAGEGGRSVHEIYQQVGTICANFENLQDEVIQLFQVICGGPPHGQERMSRIISTTTSFKVKLELIKEAARIFLQDDHEKMDAVLLWIKLCERASQMRNKVVHANPAQIAFVQNGVSRQAAFLLPSPNNRKGALACGAIGTKSDYCWNAEQLGHYSSALLQLKAMLMTVREELAGISEIPQPWVLDPSALKRNQA